jgi:hypothetical protein
MMTKSHRSAVISLSDAQARIPSPESDHAVTLLEHGTLKVKLSLPVRPTVQTPHTQDELYIIVRGGAFWCTMARGTRSRLATCCLSRQGQNTKSKISPTWHYGSSSTA